MLSFNGLLVEQTVLASQFCWEGKTILSAFSYFSKFVVVRKVIWNLSAALLSETGAVLGFLTKATESWDCDWFLFGVNQWDGLREQVAESK